MNYPDYTPTQRRNGGLKRHATARRHPVYQIYLPDNPLTDNLFPSCYRHGRAGGEARARTGARERGKYIKATGENHA